MDPAIQYIVAAAATITATAATATCGFAWAIFRLAKKHERTLYGEEDNPRVGGLVRTVDELEAVLDREGYL